MYIHGNLVYCAQPYALTLLLLPFEEAAWALDLMACTVQVHACASESMCLSIMRFKLGKFILGEMTGEPLQVGGHDISSECHLRPPPCLLHRGAF